VPYPKCTVTFRTHCTSKYENLLVAVLLCAIVGHLTPITGKYCLAELAAGGNRIMQTGFCVWSGVGGEQAVGRVWGL
jgi:hypothetical protein